MDRTELMRKFEEGTATEEEMHVLMLDLLARGEVEPGFYSWLAEFAAKVYDKGKEQ